jgi:hypothetical protein
MVQRTDDDTAHRHWNHRGWGHRALRSGISELAGEAGDAIWRRVRRRRPKCRRWAKHCGSSAKTGALKYPANRIAIRKCAIRRGSQAACGGSGDRQYRRKSAKRSEVRWHWTISGISTGEPYMAAQHGYRTGMRVICHGRGVAQAEGLPAGVWEQRRAINRQMHVLRRGHQRVVSSQFNHAHRLQDESHRRRRRSSLAE